MAPPPTNAMDRQGPRGAFDVAHLSKNMQGEYGFETGKVPFIAADESLLYDQALNEPHGLDRPCVKYPCGLLACATVVGGLYNCSKFNIVKQDEIGIVTQLDGGVHLLTPGCHYSGCCTEIVKKKLNENIIENGNMHIIRVRQGFLGLAERNGKPEILLPGRHVVNDPLFIFKGDTQLSDLVIFHQTINIITIKDSEVGLCTVNGKGFFLEPGRHCINNSQFKFIGTKPRTQESIMVNSKWRVTVPSGKIGLAWEKGEPVVLEHGQVIEVDSPYFKYVGSVDMTQELIVHGSIKFIQVRQGLFGVSYDEGVLQILRPGRHVLRKPTHFLAGFLPSGQQTLGIEAVTSMSADNVGIRFDSALTIQVVDPEKAVTMLGIAAKAQGRGGRRGKKEIVRDSVKGDQFSNEEFFYNIVQQAKLALSIIIGNNKFNSSFTSTSRSMPVVIASSAEAKSDSANPEEHGSESFKQHIHDLFMQKFSHNMMENCGVKIIDMSIEDVVITNAELAKAMSQAAVAHTNLDSARIEVEESKMRAEGKARAMNILAQAEANRIRTLDDAMSKISHVTQQRELIRSTGEAIEKSKSSVFMGRNFVDVTRMLSTMSTDGSK